MIKLNKGFIKNCIFYFFVAKGAKTGIFVQLTTDRTVQHMVSEYTYVTFQQSTCINYKAVLCLTCTA